MLGRQRNASKSSLFTVNRLLDPKEGYKTPATQEHLVTRPVATAKGALPRRRHTIDARMGGHSPPPARSGSKQSAPPPETEDAVVEKKEKPKDNVDVVACQLALKHRLMLSEVKGIIQEFLKARRDEDGGMPQEEFDKVMARIFDVPAVNKTVSKGAYDAAGVDKELNIDRFLDWYKQNMFTQVNALNADQAMATSNALAYEVAAKHQVSNLAVDKIKKQFDAYDLDRSGKIDYPEFEGMFCSILKVTNRQDLNQERIKRFWSQVDSNGDGGIDFGEFCDWYMKYFDADADEEEGFSGPLQKFYEGFNPTVQRRNHVEATRRAKTLDDHLRCGL